MRSSCRWHNGIICNETIVNTAFHTTLGVGSISKEDILTMLVHLGYLGYDDEWGEVFIPNREILEEFRISTRESEEFPEFHETLLQNR